MRKSERTEYPRMYASNVWLAYRLGALDKAPACKECGSPATELSHARRHRGCYRDFLDTGNHVALCDTHIAEHEATIK